MADGGLDSGSDSGSDSGFEEIPSHDEIVELFEFVGPVTDAQVAWVQDHKEFTDRYCAGMNSMPLSFSIQRMAMYAQSAAMSDDETLVECAIERYRKIAKYIASSPSASHLMKKLAKELATASGDLLVRWFRVSRGEDYTYETIFQIKTKRLCEATLQQLLQEIAASKVPPTTM